MSPAASVALATDLCGKNAVVTGASKGIGRAIAWVLAGAGRNVLLSSRKHVDLDIVVEQANEAGLPGRMASVAANAEEPDQVSNCVDRAVQMFGPIDILANNAATNPYVGELEGWTSPEPRRPSA